MAARLLGSVHEADDAVQGTWLRLVRTDTSDVVDLRGWLTTVVSRICLDVLRARGSRREDVVDSHVELPCDEPGPEAEAVLADRVGAALLVVLDTLSPAERADGAAAAMGSPDLTGRDAVAAFFDGSARAARLVAVDGWARAVWQHRGEVTVVFAFTVEDGRVTAIELLADPDTLADLEISPAG